MPDRVDGQPAPLDLDALDRRDGDVDRPLRRVHGLDRAGERANGAQRALVQLALDRDPLRRCVSEPLGPVAQRGVTARPDVGDDLRDAGAFVSHGTSRSTGTTRIDDAPAAFSGGSRFQISSVSTAACTAICPGSAS